MSHGDDLRHALERLAIKRGAALGNMNRADLLLCLALAARCLPRGELRDEAGVNDALKTWLATTGAMLRVDHVELRRTLVDYALWQRDGYGRAYQRAAPLDDELDRLAAALETFDAERLVVEHRAAHEAQRDARRRAHEAGGDPGAGSSR